MIIEGSVNQTQSMDRLVEDAAQVRAVFGRRNEMLVADGMARYYDLVKAGNVYIASTTAAQATSVNSGTATGLILFNPAGSNKNFILLELCVALASLPAGAAPLILTGAAVPSSTAITHTAALTIQNALMGSGNKSVGFADSSSTIPTPAIVRALGGGPAATVAGSTSFPPFIKDNIDGAIVLSPGSCISLQSLTTAISVVASLSWAEEWL